MVTVTFWRAYNIRDWWLENLLVAAVLLALALSYRRVPLSNLSYLLLFAFLCFHEYGAIYSYSNVPMEGVFAWLDGERNHYDRLVHFCYGLLLVPTCVELLDRVAAPRGAWRHVLPVTFVMSHALLFELFEWIAASIFGGELGQAYLGTQGDEWDAQKDMALAGSGAVLTMLVIAGINWRYDPDFWKDMREGFRVKAEQPLGEVRLRELIAARRENNKVADDPPGAG